MRSKLFAAGVGVVLVMIGGVGVYVWWWVPREEARALGASAATPQQQALWNDVGARLPSGIRRLEAPATPIDQPSPATGQSQSVAPGTVTLAGVQNGGRLLATSETGEWQLTGNAVVTAVNGARVDVRVGPNGTLAFAAKIEGRVLSAAPLSIAPNSPIYIDAAERGPAIEREQFLAVETNSGGVFISALRRSQMAATFTTKLSTVSFSAVQIGTPGGGRRMVEAQVTSGNETKMLLPGQTTKVGTLTVRLDASYYDPTPENERGAFALEVSAWRLMP